MEQGWQLALDGIRNPGNLGSILRSAAWFGLQEVLCSSDCVDPFSPKTVRASMGSVLHCAPRIMDLHGLLSRCSQPVYVAVPDGGLHPKELPSPGILVIGNEANGVQEDIISLAEAKVSIPRTGTAESLNAAMAASILLYAVHQR